MNKKAEISNQWFHFVLISAIIGLGVLLFSLILSNYRTNENLVLSNKKYISKQFKEKVEHASFTIKKKVQDLQEIANSREFDIFYENKALNMSMEYGLKASLLKLRNKANAVLDAGDQWYEIPFSRLEYVEKNGTVLVRIARNMKEGPFTPDSLTVKVISQEQGMTSNYDILGEDMILSVPYYFKGELIGYVFGTFPLEALGHHILHQIEGANKSAFLLKISEKIKALMETELTNFEKPINERRFLDNEAFENVLVGKIILPGISGKQEPFVILQEVIPYTPLVLIQLITSDEFEGSEDASQLLVILIVLSAFIFTVGLIIFVLNYKNLNLQAKVRIEETRTSEVEKKIRERTRELYLLTEEMKTEIENRKLIEKNLREAQEQLLQSEKMASLGQLSAGIAHEINNPIGYINSNLKTIRGYGNTLVKALEQREDRGVLGKEMKSDQFSQEGDAKEKELKDEISFISKDIFEAIDESVLGIERIKKIINDLKTFSHAADDSFSDFDLNESIERSLNIVWNELKYKADVKKELGDIPKIQGYANQIEQVIMNMLINASHAIDGHGVITVRTYMKDDSVITEISDTGTGIPEEILAKIFDPFFTTKEVGKGTGLGLSVSYNIIQKHMGMIEVDSEVGKGTTFRIKLPVYRTCSMPPA